MYELSAKSFDRGVMEDWDCLGTEQLFRKEERTIPGPLKLRL